MFKRTFWKARDDIPNDSIQSVTASLLEKEKHNTKLAKKDEKTLHNSMVAANYYLGQELSHDGYVFSDGKGLPPIKCPLGILYIKSNVSCLKEDLSMPCFKKPMLQAST